MSKKEEFKYLSYPEPKGQRTSKINKVNWSGLNRRYTTDSGELSFESNISTAEFPYLTPSQSLRELGIKNDYYANKEIISLHGFDEFLITVYIEFVNGAYEVRIDYITLAQNQNNANKIYTGVIKQLSDTDSVEAERRTQRSIVQFNLFTDPTDVLNGYYKKKLLIFPDRLSMGYQIINTSIKPNYIESPDYDAIYCYAKNGNEYYYKWSEATGAFVQDTDTGISHTFTLDKLYVDFEQFYSDGYVISNDEYDETQTYYRCTKKDIPYEYTEINLTAPTQDGSDDKEYRKGKYYISTSDYSPKTSREDISEKTGVYYLNKYDSCMYVVENGEWEKTIAANCPKIKMATVHQSRLFGVDDKRVYASAFNDYSDFVLDSIDDENERNAWCSAAQSNIKADGVFTGITTYNNRVVLLKKDYLQEVYGLNNPFRIVDVGTDGTIDNRTIQEVSGLLYFVSENDVKVYNGATVKSVGYKINVNRFKEAVSGSDGRFYYLWCYLSGNNEERCLFVYDTMCGQWSQRFCDYSVLSFAKTGKGIFMLTNSTDDKQMIYKIDSDSYKSTEWSFETDVMMSGSVDIKHLSKLQIFCDMEVESEIKIYAVYNNEEFNENTSQLLYFKVNVTGKKITVPIRIKPRMSAHYGCKLHFCGMGYVKIYSMEIFISEGGGLYG